MAHKIIDGRHVVDWTTGDPEGDRITLLSAYRDMITELIELNDNAINSGDVAQGLPDILERWNVSTGNQIDEVPRTWITRPE